MKFSPPLVCAHELNGLFKGWQYVQRCASDKAKLGETRGQPVVVLKLVRVTESIVPQIGDVAPIRTDRADHILIILVVGTFQFD